MVAPPTIFQMVDPLWYQHPGVLYTTKHRVVGEEALKERARTRKGICGLEASLARHNAVLVLVVSAPMPRWQAVVPTYLEEVVVGARVAKTTKDEIVYPKGYAAKVSTAMMDTIKAEHLVSKVRALPP